MCRVVEVLDGDWMVDHEWEDGIELGVAWEVVAIFLCVDDFFGHDIVIVVAAELGSFDAGYWSRSGIRRSA